ncbi:MAG: ROK family protein, partial [Gemmatimonadetes bacterium]|nr:ROK family protein [Gemmatimonadota bacterium]
ASDWAGEVGHMSVRHPGRACSCGGCGCIEAYASGPALAARAAEGIDSAPNSSLAALVREGPGPVTAEAVCGAAAAGDAYAVRVVEETARILAVGVANLIHLFNPEMIVLGGGLSGAGEVLFGPLRAEVRRRTFRPAWEACSIVAARFPNTAGMIGAAGVLKRAIHG